MTPKQKTACLQVADAIEKMPEKYDQNNWGSFSGAFPQRARDCGSSQCIAGWAVEVQMAADIPEEDWVEYDNLPKRSNRRPAALRKMFDQWAEQTAPEEQPIMTVLGAKVLGLTPDQARTVFLDLPIDTRPKVAVDLLRTASESGWENALYKTGLTLV